MSTPKYKWNPCDLNAATKLLGITGFPGQVFPLDVSCLPKGVQKLPGLTKAYISGFIEPKPAASKLSGVGEFVAVRYEGTTGKGYNFGLGLSGDGSVFFIGPFKHFSGHHFDSGAAVPIEDLFNRSSYGGTP